MYTSHHLWGPARATGFSAAWTERLPGRCAWPITGPPQRSSFQIVREREARRKQFRIVNAAPASRHADCLTRPVTKAGFRRSPFLLSVLSVAVLLVSLPVQVLLYPTSWREVHGTCLHRVSMILDGICSDCVLLVFRVQREGWRRTCISWGF